MRSLIAVGAVAMVLAAGCSSESSSEPEAPGQGPSTSKPLPSDVSEVDEDEFGDQRALHDLAPGDPGSVGCTTREDCDIEFVVESVGPIACDAYGMTSDQQVVRVAIEAQARKENAYPGALQVFNLGSWTALTDDGYTLRSLEMATSCAGADSSLLGYGINPGEKVRNNIDFLVPANVEKIRLQPMDLEGGGWSWEIAEQE